MSKSQKLQEKLSALKLEMINLKPQVDRYYEVASLYSKIEKEYKEILEFQNLEEWTQKTNYYSPDFPSMGNTGHSGGATFNSKNDAENLVRILNDKTDYFASYVLHWAGTGYYNADVSWRTDHDGDIVYTIDFKKFGDL